MDPYKRLQSIIDHGNRGHNHADNNHFTCADGFRLSVLAGGGTYCRPRPQLCCICGEGGGPSTRTYGSQVSHNYPGPYTSLEVADLAELDRTGDGISMLTVTELHLLIASHGGLVEDGEDAA